MLGEEAGPAVSESERGPGRHRGGGEDKHILFSPLRELISSCRGAIHSGLGLDFGPSEDGPGKPGLERLFYFYIFRKHFFTEIYFQYHNLQFCTPTARQGGGRGPAAQQRGGRDLYVNLKKIICAEILGGRQGACRPPGGRQAPCCGQLAVAIRCVAIRCVLDMDTNKNH